MNKYYKNNKKILIFLLISIIFLKSASRVSALTVGNPCSIDNDQCDKSSNLYCQPNPVAGATITHYCQQALTIGQECNPQRDVCDKKAGLSCDPNPVAGATIKNYCQQNAIGSIFGKIKPPDALKGLIAKDPTGAGGISLFLSNLIALIYSIAFVVLIFMLIWGAFDWMTSGGDKEKLAKAQQRIINAFIGILLFAVAFAIIQVLGVFTGFKFFEGQKP
ncbi:hypothetical protein HYW41_00710 [Candidatus Daviesbacteria bacterium]|nr:hypothetical protein [Candidatus Daviesbacteria bacterium]